MTAPPFDSVAVSCAFEENAVRSLSVRAERSGSLSLRMMPDHGLVHDAARRLRRLPGSPAPIDRYVTKVTTRSRDRALPHDLLTSRVSEPLRIAGGRFRHPATGYVGNYLWKAVFDRAAARVTLPEHVDLLIGMPGSCLRTFEANPAPWKVFHAIDAHPRARNEALRRVYGRRRTRAEAYPEALVRRIERELALADVVLVPSTVVADQMIAHGVAVEKVVRVPYGVDLGTFRYSGGAAKNATRPRVISVGQLGLRKGTPLLLEAARGLDLDVVLAGQVFDRAAVAGAPGNVRLLGVLTAEELAAEYDRADAFVLPTIEDACSLVVAEAAAAGLPVITTDNNGASELLDNHHTIVPAGDVSALRTALAAVVVPEPSLRRAIAHSARSGDGAFSSWDDYADAAYAAISTTIATRTGRR